MDESKRLIELEMLFTHLQKTVFDLDRVVIDQARRIDMLQREVKGLVSELRMMRDTSREVRRPEDEIPPHY
jgi:uncharacterized coiled-coil protein SlyX